ncbi:MAG: hypothetical protein U0Y10_08535 [Spirosomataceae bacterium]
MKKTVKTLALKTDKVVNLSDKQLNAVKGGVPTAYTRKNTCFCL